MHLSEFGISLNETLNHLLPGTTTTGQTIRSDVQVENDTAPVMRGGFLIKAHVQVCDFRATAWAQMRKKRQISVFEGKIEKQRELAETDRGIFWWPQTGLSDVEVKEAAGQHIHCKFTEAIIHQKSSLFAYAL